MMESQASLSHDRTSTNNLAGLETTTVHCSEFDWETVSQTILKLDRTFLHPCLISAEISPIILNSWERLVKIIAELRSPASGWSSDLPQTPENLTPYVTEEAYEVLEAIDNESQLKNTWINPPKLSPSPQSVEYIHIENLIPQLLWYIARTADDVMRFLAGVKAQVLSPNLEPSTGTLRLVAILTIDSATPWSIDLATKEPAQNQEVPTLFQLMPDTLIQSNEGYFCKQPRRCDSLIQYFRYKIQQANLETEIFTGRTQIELLQPGQNWQLGEMEVRFQLEFVSNSEPETLKVALPTANCEEDNKESGEKIENPVVETSTTTLTNPKLSSVISNQTEASSPDRVEIVKLLQSPTPFLENLVWVTDRVLLERYYQSLSKQQLVGFLSECQKVENRNFQAEESSEPRESSEDFIEEIEPQNLHFLDYDAQINNSQLVNQTLKRTDRMYSTINSACQVVDALKKTHLDQEPSWVGLEMRMIDLTQKLLWQAIASSYEIMQLFGGVKARVLQPNCYWETGLLRLIAILEVKIADESWEIDITSGQSPKTNVWPLASKGIIQSNHNNLCKEPVEVATFLRSIICELQQNSGDVALWMEDTGVNLRYHRPESDSIKSSEDNNLLGVEADWTNERSGIVKLSINFDWMPNASLLSFK